LFPFTRLSLVTSTSRVILIPFVNVGYDWYPVPGGSIWNAFVRRVIIISFVNVGYDWCPVPGGSIWDAFVGLVFTSASHRSDYPSHEATGLLIFLAGPLCLFVWTRIRVDPRIFKVTSASAAAPSSTVFGCAPTFEHIAVLLVKVILPYLALFPLTLFFRHNSDLWDWGRNPAWVRTSIRHLIATEHFSRTRSRSAAWTTVLLQVIIVYYCLRSSLVLFPRSPTSIKAAVASDRIQYRLGTSMHIFSKGALINIVSGMPRFVIFRIFRMVSGGSRSSIDYKPITSMDFSNLFFSSDRLLYR
jgi:hypothetical protein